MEEINWMGDEWFAAHHDPTPEFKTWWKDFYGRPEQYEDRHEYWIRCAFAWAGWKAARS